MKFKIINPKDDMQGNQRENIFILMDEKNGYLGSGYVFPKLSPQLTPAHPLNIFLDMHIEEELMNQKAGEMLYTALFERAKSLASVQPRKSLLYFGTTDVDHSLMAYLKTKGFTLEQPTYMMYRNIPVEYFDIQSSFDIIVSPHLSEDAVLELIERHNRIFVQPLTKELIHEFEHQEGFKNISVYERGVFVGNMMIYIEIIDDKKIGRIENLFVSQHYRRQGIGSLLLKAAYNYLNTHFVQAISLEVWSANENAVAFYRQSGFEIIKETEFYVGKLI